MKSSRARANEVRIFHAALNGLLTALALALGLGAPPLTPVAARAGEPMMGAYDPQNLLVIMSHAAGDRDVPTYVGCLADSFRFTPFGADRVANRDIDWSHWDRKMEVEFVKRWLSPARACGLYLNEVLSRSTTGPDRVEWDIVYRMNADGEYRSRAIFVMVRRDHDWYLQEWIDTTVETTEDGVPYSTSGDVRARLMR